MSRVETSVSGMKVANPAGALPLFPPVCVFAGSQMLISLQPVENMFMPHFTPQNTILQKKEEEEDH